MTDRGGSRFDGPIFLRCAFCTNWSSAYRAERPVCQKHDRMIRAGTWLALVLAFAFPVLMYLYVA